MATKTISITEEAYERLAAKKAERESFTDVILRMTGKVKLTDFAGALSPKTADVVERRIRELRKRSAERAHRIKELLS